MAKVYRISANSLKNIADAIRFKNNTTTKYSIAEMPEAIKLNTGGSAYVVDGEQTLLITGTYQGTSLIVTENTLINLRDYLEQKEVPLDIEIKIPTYDWSWSVLGDENNLTEAEIAVLKEMVITQTNGILCFEYDDTVLDVTFTLEDDNLVVEEDYTDAEFSINENGELEVDY